MEVYSAKGSGMYPLAFIVISAILLNAYCCAASASVLVKTNTTFRCDGRLDECLVEDNLDLELDFLINPYVSRILANTDGSQTGGSGNPNEAAIACGRKYANGSQQYAQCISNFKDNAPKNCDPKSAYDRCDRQKKH